MKICFERNTWVSFPAHPAQTAPLVSHQPIYITASGALISCTAPGDLVKAQTRLRQAWGRAWQSACLASRQGRLRWQVHLIITSTHRADRAFVLPRPILAAFCFQSVA